MIFNGGLIPDLYGRPQPPYAGHLLVADHTGVLRRIQYHHHAHLLLPGAAALSEAATIDGAGHFRILCQIILPVSKSIIAVIVLFYAIQQ